MSQGIKARNMMLVQQIEKLEITLSELDDRLSDMPGLLEWAYIVHDKDKVDVTDKFDIAGVHGELVKPHVHVAMRFKAQRHINSIADLLSVQPQYIKKWDGRYDNMFSYLVHRTAGSEKKYQYTDDKVTANFDFIERMEKIEKAVKYNMRKYVDEKIKEYAEELISFEELENDIGIYHTTKHQKHIDDITKSLNRKRHKEFIQRMEEGNFMKKVIYIYGQSKTGKTFYAKETAKRMGKDYFMSDQKKDPFQEYDNQEVVILDELRPGDQTYNNLLRLLDPHNYEGAVDSRYYNKRLQAHTFIITTSLSPDTFFNMSQYNDDSFSLSDEETDVQFFRRINVIEVAKDEILFYDYDYDNNNFVVDPTLTMENKMPEIAKKRLSKQTTPVNVNKEVSAKLREIYISEGV